MNQEERSERSRGLILDAALTLFSHQGYRATSIRDIAAKANVSTGAVYHHFSDKEELFTTLISQLQAEVESPEFPLYKLLESGVFPTQLKEVGRVCREIVAAKRPYIALIYVDVVEFEGIHIREFYKGMAALCERFVAEHQGSVPIADRLREGLPPAAAMIMTFRMFLDYAVVELLFGIPDHFGLESEHALNVIAGILETGMMSPVPAIAANTAT